MLGRHDKTHPEDHAKALAAMIGITLLLYLCLPGPASDDQAWSVLPSIEPLRVDMVIY